MGNSLFEAQTSPLTKGPQLTWSETEFQTECFFSLIPYYVSEVVISLSLNYTDPFIWGSLSKYDLQLSLDLWRIFRKLTSISTCGENPDIHFPLTAFFVWLFSNKTLYLQIKLLWDHWLKWLIKNNFRGENLKIIFSYWILLKFFP